MSVLPDATPNDLRAALAAKASALAEVLRRDADDLAASPLHVEIAGKLATTASAAERVAEACHVGVGSRTGAESES